MSKQKPKPKPRPKQSKQRALAIRPLPRHLGIITETGWIPPPGAEQIPTAQWAAVGNGLGRAAATLRWALGDWWAHGERFEYGARCAALAESGIDLEPQTLMHYATVSRAFATTCRRRQVLSYTHHKAVAALPAQEADRLLDLAERQNLSSHALRELVAKRQAGEIADASDAIEAEGETNEINPPQHQDDFKNSNENLKNSNADEHDHGAPAARRRHRGNKQELLTRFDKGTVELWPLVQKPEALFVGASLSPSQLRMVSIFLEHIAAAIGGRVIDDPIAAHLISSSVGVRVIASGPH